MASEVHFIWRQSPHLVAFSLGHRTFPWAPTGRTSGIPPRVKLRGLGGEETRIQPQEQVPGRAGDLGAQRWVRASSPPSGRVSDGAATAGPTGALCQLGAGQPLSGVVCPGAPPVLPRVGDKGVSRAHQMGRVFGLRCFCGCQAARHWGSPGPSPRSCPADLACPECM